MDKNKIKNKDLAKIYAFYLGQFYILDDDPQVALHINWETIMALQLHPDHRMHCKLLLKPLSSIPQEDKDALGAYLLECNEILSGYASHINIIVDTELSKPPESLCYIVADWLRRNGYALPYEGKSLFETDLAVDATNAVKEYY